MHSRFHALLLGGLAICVSACAGDGPESVDSSSWFARLQAGVFDQNCTTAGCHNPQAAAGNLVLTAPFSFDALVGVTPTTLAAAQAGLLLVSPFDPDGSFLLTKVINPGPGQGSRMPQGAEPLSAAQIETIRDWIEEGAPRFDTTPTQTDPTATASPTDLPETPTATPPPSSPTATGMPTEPTQSPLPGTPSATAAADTPTPTEAPPTATPSEPTPVPTVSLAQVQAEIFSPSCAIQFCHSGPFPAANLDLEEGQSFGELVNVVPLTVAAANAGMLLVDPGNAENSFLYVKITNPTAEQGFLMPLTGSRLTEQQVALVRAWIESLAP